MGNASTGRPLDTYGIPGLAPFVHAERESDAVTGDGDAWPSTIGGKWRARGFQFAQERVGVNLLNLPARVIGWLLRWLKVGSTFLRIQTGAIWKGKR